MPAGPGGRLPSPVRLSSSFEYVECVDLEKARSPLCTREGTYLEPALNGSPCHAKHFPDLLRRFPLFGEHPILLLVRQAIWKIRPKMVYNGRISDASQVYLPIANRTG